MLGVAATYLGPAERPPAITRMALPRLPAPAVRVCPRANDNTLGRRDRARHASRNGSADQLLER